ncbi:hypothetical protein BC826DRAFT_1175574 [Russula brevipes]|nr:hypothetical protein BC826DRAFT_1175574 [Russula brevipes]
MNRDWRSAAWLGLCPSSKEQSWPDDRPAAYPLQEDIYTIPLTDSTYRHIDFNITQLTRAWAFKKTEVNGEGGLTQICRFMIQPNRGNVYQLGSVQFPLIIRVPTIAGSTDIAAIRRPLHLVPFWGITSHTHAPVFFLDEIVASQLTSVSSCLAGDHATPGDVKRASPLYRRSLYQPASENRIWITVVPQAQLREPTPATSEYGQEIVRLTFAICCGTPLGVKTDMEDVLLLDGTLLLDQRSNSSGRLNCKGGWCRVISNLLFLAIVPELYDGRRNKLIKEFIEDGAPHLRCASAESTGFERAGVKPSIAVDTPHHELTEYEKSSHGISVVRVAGAAVPKDVKEEEFPSAADYFRPLTPS